MKPLRVALFVKPSPATVRREDRNMGYWSYPVSEFTWEHFPHNGERVDLSKFRDYDLIFHEDAGFCTYENKQAGPPVVYIAIDSTLSDAHYQERLRQASQAHVVLVDHDKVDRFRNGKQRVLPFPYCVNDNVFKPLEKSIDIVNHCSGGKRADMPGATERSAMRGFFGDYTQRAGYSYKSGAVGLDEYAANMGSARIVINWPRTSINRPHRVFDSMACGAFLVTGKIPWVDGDLIESGVQYQSAEHWSDFVPIIGYTLRTGEWKDYAAAGFELVSRQHTWKVRAIELREIVARELGL